MRGLDNFEKFENLDTVPCAPPCWRNANSRSKAIALPARAHRNNPKSSKDSTRGKASLLW
jgi:hypothetical protein